MRFIDGEDRVRDWQAYYDTPSYHAWRGNAFEMVCIAHLAQLRHVLQLSSMQTTEFPWTSESSSPAAQVDLVIERPDKITYLCEMKCTNAALAIDAGLVGELERKRSVFKEETGTRSSVQNVLISAAGVRGQGRGDLAQLVTGDDLFVF